MFTLIITIHLLLACTIVALILLQQGRGAETGSAFGSGASQTMFGAPGSGNVLTHLTAVLVALFFVTSVSIAFYSKLRLDESSSERLETLSEELREEALSDDADPELPGDSEIEAPDFPDQ